MRALYLSVAPVEELLIYHVCPGEAAARLVVPRAPWRCGNCRWAEIVDEEGLVVRDAGPEVFRLLRLPAPRVFLLDGPEPLAALGEEAYKLPRIVEEAAGGVVEAYGFYSMGLAGPGAVRRAAEAGYVFAVFEYTAPLEPPPSLERVAESLKEAYRRLEVLEIIMHHDGSREATVAAAGLAERYPEAGLHLLARTGAEDRVYEAAERLRERLGVNVYPHPEESYTLTDTVCRNCGAVLVERKPWGVRVYAEPLSGRRGRSRCPRCGSEARLVACHGSTRRARALHREVVVW